MAESNHFNNCVRPCVKCGSIERKSNGACKACAKSYDAEYRKNNREKMRLLHADYRARHPEAIKKVRARSYWNDPDKARKEAADWRAMNPEKVKASNEKWSKNSDSRRIARRKWAYKNQEKLRAAIAAWAKANGGKRRIYGQNRRSLVRSGGKLSMGLSVKLLKQQRYRCACCCRKLGGDYHLDHIMPLALGGGNIDENIQVLCPSCNCKKGAKHPIKFMQERGFLL